MGGRHSITFFTAHRALASAAPATSSAPSSLHVNAQGINFPRICVGAHNCASKPKGVRIYRRHRCVCHCWPRSPPSPVLFNEPSKACTLIRPQPSSRRQAVQRCAGTSVVGRVHPCFAIAQCHLIALPWQRDLSCRYCHHHPFCGHHHQGATQRQTQPTGQCHCAAGGSRGTERQALHCRRNRGMTLTVFTMLYSCSTN